jgi:hypothetical protein
MTRPSLVLAALLLPLAGHAASVTSPYTITINAPTAFTVTSPSLFTPAPVPNQDITRGNRIEDPGPTLSGRLEQPRILLRSGDGFTPHSSFSEELEMRSRGLTPGLVPTITLKVPLD